MSVTVIRKSRSWVTCRISHFTKLTLPAGMISSACLRVAVDQNPAGAWSGEPGQKPRRAQTGKRRCGDTFMKASRSGYWAISAGSLLPGARSLREQLTAILAVQRTTASLLKKYGRWSAFSFVASCEAKAWQNGLSRLRCGTPRSAAQKSSRPIPLNRDRRATASWGTCRHLQQQGFMRSAEREHAGMSCGGHCPSMTDRLRSVPASFGGHTRPPRSCFARITPTRRDAAGSRASSCLGRNPHWRR
jgi:hypothetical protein